MAKLIKIIVLGIVILSDIVLAFAIFLSKF